MTGFIKLHRKLKEWEWYQDDNVFRLFMHLLLSANYKDKNWRGMVIKRGQLVIGTAKFGAEVGLSWQQTRTALEKLKNTKEITTKPTSKNLIVTIVNFDLYQDRESKDNNQNNKQTNKQVTNKQQANNKQITTTKEYKEYKEYKERKNIYLSDDKKKNSSSSSKFVKPTLEEVQEYCIEKGWKLSFAEVFLDGNDQRGWKLNNGKTMKDWKAACRSWMRHDYNSKYIDSNSSVHTERIKEAKTASEAMQQLSPAQQVKYTEYLSNVLKRFLNNPAITAEQRESYQLKSNKDFINQIKTDHPKILESCLKEYQERIIKAL